MKAFGNEARFVPFNGAISVSFDTKNPFAAHKIDMGFDGTRDHVPLFRSAVNSVFMVERHWGCFDASVKQLGSWRRVSCTAMRAFGRGYLIKPGNRCFGLLILTRLHVIMGC